MTRKPLQPIDAFEADLWGLWDMLKRALDDQESWREHRPTGFMTWVVEKCDKWNFYVGLDALVQSAMPIEYRAAYGGWLTSRGIDNWVPPDGGPFWWGAPGPNLAQVMETIKTKREAYEAFKAKLRQQQKDYLKKYKTEQRAKDRAAKKAAKEQEHGRSVSSDSTVNEL